MFSFPGPEYRENHFFEKKDCNEKREKAPLKKTMLQKIKRDC